jgi:threonine/homoserine/homoserine lactone efflux protein
MAYIIGAAVLIWGLWQFFSQQDRPANSAGDTPQPSPPRPTQAEAMLDDMMAAARSSAPAPA